MLCIHAGSLKGNLWALCVEGLSLGSGFKESLPVLSVGPSPLSLSLRATCTKVVSLPWEHPIPGGLPCWGGLGWGSWHLVWSIRFWLMKGPSCLTHLHYTSHLLAVMGLVRSQVQKARGILGSTQAQRSPFSALCCPAALTSKFSRIEGREAPAAHVSSQQTSLLGTQPHL